MKVTIKMLKDASLKGGLSLKKGKEYTADIFKDGRAKVDFPGHGGAVCVIVSKKSYSLIEEPDDGLTLNIILGDHFDAVAERLLDAHRLFCGDMEQVQTERDGLMDTDIHIHTETFKTEVERDAFIRGLNLADGYYSSRVLEPEEMKTLTEILNKTKEKTT